ncbi:hypothetical protein [Chelativorans intermedius]|uniref:HTH HARE-type domain-containing protein n=1 Tax=Chelativorans intermedius TaxID=515947 RepID=A0ABV6D3G9_9HYPH|nr:hypothetical protein [Chelativorans intermedius]MCT8996894.1 hypothetical protein [Chelativorans intermedius]
MNRNFHELKQQLTELSATINKFESEAVQLRIVELLFSQAGGEGLAEAPASAYVSGPARGGRRPQTADRRKTAPSASGAVAALAKLLDGDFFSEKRTIGDIVKKCEEEIGTRYKSNAFSGPLSRYARSGVLKREKNEEGKYVYFK